jgi:histidine triad (HIT) family protein
MNETNCVFCRIARGEIHAQLVHEDADCVAFRDLHPQAPVHILVVPRRHVPTLLDARRESPEWLGRLYQVAIAVAEASGLAASGFRVVANCGSDGGQSVWHLHLHVLGGRTLAWPPG